MRCNGLMGGVLHCNGINMIKCSINFPRCVIAMACPEFGINLTFGTIIETSIHISLRCSISYDTHDTDFKMFEKQWDYV